MNPVRITVIRKADYKDLQAQYENPIQHACDLTVGQTFLSLDPLTCLRYGLDSDEEIAPSASNLI